MEGNIQGADDMKIVVLHGQMHKGSTYNITKLFLENLSDENTEITEFFMPENAPSFCMGCFSCFIVSEEKCPHADVVQPIVKAIDEADLLILESPCYVLGMSGQLKTLLDHLAYRWMIHRPHPEMFSKVGLAISTAAGAGTKKVTKSLKDNLFHWGVPKIYRYGKNVGAMGWETVKPEKKLQIEKEVRRLSKQISKQIGRVKPGIKTKLMFLIMRMGQKANDWNPTDKEYWIRNGWLNDKRPW
jgi:multimeric flavodoxin WrbA